MYKVFSMTLSSEIASEIKKSSNHNITRMVNSDCYDFVNQIVSEVQSGGLQV